MNKLYDFIDSKVNELYEGITNKMSNLHNSGILEDIAIKGNEIAVLQRVENYKNRNLIISNKQTGELLHDLYYKPIKKDYIFEILKNLTLASFVAIPAIKIFKGDMIAPERIAKAAIMLPLLTMVGSMITCKMRNEKRFAKALEDYDLNCPLRE